MKMETSNPAQPSKHHSLSLNPISSEEASDDNNMVESKSSSSEASDSSMSESSGDSERDSTEVEPELERHVPQSQPSNGFPAQEAPVDDSSAAERPVLQNSTSDAKPSEEASGLQELTKVLDNDEPLEVEDSADEAYSPKLDASGDEEEIDINSDVSGSSHGDADMKLTPKFQEQVVIASKNDALDVR
jgi:hypothetical protein